MSTTQWEIWNASPDPEFSLGSAAFPRMPFRSTPSASFQLIELGEDSWNVLCVISEKCIYLSPSLFACCRRYSVATCYWGRVPMPVPYNVDMQDAKMQIIFYIYLCSQQLVSTPNILYIYIHGCAFCCETWLSLCCKTVYAFSVCLNIGVREFNGNPSVLMQSDAPVCLSAAYVCRYEILQLDLAC